MDVKICKANIDDLDTLKVFEQEVIKYERPFAPNLKNDPISYYDLLDLIQREDALLLIAKKNQEIIGSGYGLIQKSAPYKKPDRFVYLGFMFVLPSYRGQGINGKIIQQLLEWASKNSITEIQLDVYSENTSAINAYKKLGFQPDLLKMRLNTEK